MEEELSNLKQEEMERNKILLDLGSQRDRVALSIANKLAKVKEVEASCRIKVGPHSGQPQCCFDADALFLPHETACNCEKLYVTSGPRRC